MSNVITPVIQFDPAQRRLFADRSPVTIANFHRQKGKDFTAAGMAVDDALRTGRNWYIISLTQRQADATFAKCKKVAVAARALYGAASDFSESDYGSEQYDKWLRQAFQFTARRITLPNGATIESLPGRDPDTLAGLTGNIIFTEFGLFPGGGYDHWRTVFPLTTRGFRCIVISTPRGKNTKFYELWANENGENSVHTCDIWQSIAEGFSPDGPGGAQWTLDDVEALRKRYNDASGWLREYECQFTGDMSALVSWAELERASALGEGLPFDWLRIDDDASSDAAQVFLALKSEITAGGRVEAGWDVARHGHLSVIMFNFARANRPKHLRFGLGMRGCTFELQRAMVRKVMDLQKWSVGHGDATGLGMDSNETLARLYRDRWTPFNFNGASKRELASSLKTAFTDGNQTLPSMNGPHKFIATDIYAIQKDDTGAAMSLSETENPLLDESHCDIAYSLGLGRLAGSKHFRPPLKAPQRQKPRGY